MNTVIENQYVPSQPRAQGACAGFATPLTWLVSQNILSANLAMARWAFGYITLGFVKRFASIMKKLAFLAAFALLNSQAIAASFDCSKASTHVERAICADSLLGRLDVALAQNYRGMLASDFGGSKKALREEQLKWISQRNKCTNAKCLIDAYRKRLDETCEYGVVTGVHPHCTLSEDIK